MIQQRDLTSNENCVCFNVRRVSRILSQFMAAELEPHGLLPTQTPILGILAAKPEASMAEVSEFLGMDRTTLVRNLKPLEREGLVTASGKGRGGKVSLALTAKGKGAFRKLLPDWQAAQRKIVQTLGAERWSAILTDLERATGALEH